MNRSITGALAALPLSGATLVSVGAPSATAATEAGQRSDAAAPVTADSPTHGKGNRSHPWQGQPKPRPKAVTFEGTVALSNCSGAVVRLPNSTDRDPALVMSNGHCLEGGFPASGEVVVDRPSSRTSPSSTRVPVTRARCARRRSRTPR